jgi:lipopolysaccharide/colanic/teichoic acid biosynthesis glycosyltransferase
MPRKLQIAIKYTMDRVVALALLILFFPLLAFMAVLVKMLDGGTMLFVQERPGLNGELFRMCKFRTMVPDADQLLDEKGRVADVNRVTRLGRILRTLSLDELPQLFNVLGGSMSLIGPRPAIPQHLARYTERQKRRLRTKPGITGLAQVSGRNMLKWSERIELDLEYIENYSLLLDLKILVRTAVVVVLRKGISPDRNPDQVDDLGPAKEPDHETGIPAIGSNHASRT